MSDSLKKQLLSRLSNLPSPDGKTNILVANHLSEIVILDKKIYLSLQITPAAVSFFDDLRKQITLICEELAPTYKAVITLNQPKTVSTRQKKGASMRKPVPLDRVKNIIAIASGKGGVGKSTIAHCLALAFTQLGYTTGLLDADVYGPSLPEIVGFSEKPQLDENKKILPLMYKNIKVMSMGFLLEKNEAAVWRGPMVMGAIKQLLHEVQWGPLDILVVDMPPGTGDAQLSLVQQVRLAGAVIVSTPQELALIDARRAIDMFRKVNTPILGVVENMSYFIAPDTGQLYDLFGQGGAYKMARNFNVPFLAEIPFALSLQEAQDGKTALFESQTTDKLSAIFLAMAKEICERIQSESGERNVEE